MTTPTDSLDTRIAEARLALLREIEAFTSGRDSVVDNIARRTAAAMRLHGLLEEKAQSTPGEWGLSYKDLAERSRAALAARNTEVFELQQQLTKANAALVTARADALEEAAVECERHIPWWTHESGGSSARLCAQFIRSLVKDPR